MRRILLFVLAGVAVVVIGAVILISSIDVNKYRPQIEAQLEKSLHRKTSLGPMNVSIFPLGVKVKDLTIAEDPAFNSTQPFAKASDVAVSAGLFSLLRGAPEVKSVSLQRPTVELIRNAQGRWNFQSMTSSNKTSDKETPLSLDKLEIVDGQVAYTDALNNVPRTIYDHIGMRLNDYAPGKRFGFDLDAHLPGAGKQVISLQSKIGPIPEGSPAATPVDGKISLQEVTLSGLTKFASGSMPPNTDGNVSGDADISSEASVVSAKGNLKLSDAVIRGSKLGFPVESRFDLTQDRSKDLLSIRSADLKLGGTPFQISGTVAGGKPPAPSQLNVRLKTEDAALTDLAKLAGSMGVAFNPDYQIKGRLTADVTAKGPSTAPQLSGNITAKQLDVSGGEIKQPVQVSEIDLAMTPQSITSKPFTAKSGSTSVNGTFTANNYSTKAATVDATLNTQNADVAELVNMAKAYGFEGSKGMTASGRLSVNVHAQGPVYQSSKMTFAGSGSVNNMNIQAPAALTKPVSIPSANLKFAQNSAGIENLVMNIGSTSIRGNLSASNFAAPQLSFNLASDKLVTSELEQLTATPKSGAAANATKQPAATARPAASEPSLLNRTTGSGTLKVGTLVAENIVMSNVSTNVKLNNGLITLSPLSADVFGGKVGGTINLNARGAQTGVGLNTKLAGINTNQLLSAVSSMKDRLTGTLSANPNLTFTLGPGDTITRTLNGTLGFNVANGELRGINILNEVSKVGKFLNPGAAASGGGNSTALTKLAGNLAVHNGEATTNDLVAALSAGSLSAKGVINLVSQALNLDVNAVLSSGVSQAAGGLKVGGFMNTALANNKGELVVPVKVTGTFDHPVVTPDAAAIAQMKVKNLLPTSGNPAAGVAGAVLGGKAGGAGGVVQGLLGGGQKQNGQAQQQQQQQKQQTPQDAVKGILGGFGRKPKS